MTFDELVTGVLEEGGFDVPSARAGGWLNEMHRQAVADSEWLQQQISLGTTVVGQSDYDIPDDVAELQGVYIADDQGNPGHWDRVSTTDMWEIKAGRRRLTGSGGVLCAKFGTAGQKRVELYPAPLTAGSDIVGLAAMVPATMASGDSPIIPTDMHGDLMDGAIALGLLRMDERGDAAQVFDAKFQRMVAKLRKRRVKRVGSRSSRIQLRGHDFA